MVELEIVAGIASYKQYYTPVVLNVYKQKPRYLAVLDDYFFKLKDK